MNTERVEMWMDHIDEKYIYESNEYIEKRKSFFHRTLRKLAGTATCLACLVLLPVSAVTAASFAGSMTAYDMLYSLYPEAAKKLTPVHLSSIDNGIKMEVESVYLQEDTAQIYVSMQDLEKERIDSTIDLFDSYAIHASGSSVGTCHFIYFDPESRKATFLISLQRMDKKKIEGQKLVFSVSEFLSGKSEVDEELPQISLSGLEVSNNLQKEIQMRGWEGSGEVNEIENRIEGMPGFLRTNDKQSFSPVEGVTVTAYGFVDDQLHIQVHYEDILATDNHGYVYLKDSKGKEINSYMSVSFWDEEHTGSYQEYVFAVGAKEELADYSVRGYFKTSQKLTAGNWKVTLPLEQREESSGQ